MAPFGAAAGELQVGFQLGRHALQALVAVQLMCVLTALLNQTELL